VKGVNEMSVPETIYKIIEENHLKQSSIAIAAGYDVKTFNNMLKKRKRITSSDIVPICKALRITPNELFEYDKK
jgi:DNA-binding Xre family transcriptional regulator